MPKQFSRITSSDTSQLLPTVLLMGLAILHVVITRLSWSDIPLQTDAGMWAYIGRRILDGSLLYNELWESKPPGIYYVFAAVEWLFRDNAVVALRCLDALLSLAVFGVTYRLARRFASPVASAAATVLLSLVFCHRILSDWGDNVEKFVALLEMTGCLLFLKGIHQSREPREPASTRTVYLFATGICCGFAGLFKQTGILFFAVALFWIVWVGLRQTESRRTPARIGLLILGAAFPWAVVVGFLLRAGTLTDFWSQVIQYDLFRVGGSEGERSRLSSAEHWSNVWSHLKLIAILFMPTLLGIAWIARGLKLKADAARRNSALNLIAMYWIVSTLVFIVAPFGYGHYLLQASPGAAIIVAHFLDGATRLKPVIQPWTVALTTSLILGVFPLVDHFVFTLDADSRFRKTYAAQRKQIEALTSAIVQNTRADQKVMVWPPDAAVSYYARRRTPLESSNADVIFKGKVYRLAPPMKELIERLKADPPEVIVDWTPTRLVPPSTETGNEPLLLVSPKGFSLYDPPYDQHPAPEGRALAPLKHWIRENYGGQKKDGQVILFFRGKQWRPWPEVL
ncbi:MAG: glycosyltransferase family 39 protein [Phycisphaerales bacterium]|nr:glycosyltransferase family 39 protein [Phycisphaerales bacterium]